MARAMLLKDALPPLAVTSSRHQSARAKVGRRVVPRDSASGPAETCSRSVCFEENFLHQIESHDVSLLGYPIMMIRWFEQIKMKRVFPLTLSSL
jgi:hypothetical protein